MHIFFSIYFALLGLIIGSFLNVVIYRFNTGRTVLGRSQCFSCRRTLKWYDLIPLFSFLSTGGKCRTCKSKISWQYPIIELLTGLLFFGVFQQYADMAVRASSLFAYELVYALIQMSVLVIILVYDMRHKIIPNVFAYTFALIAFVHMFFGASAHGGLGFVVPALSTIGAGPLLAFPFYLVWLLSRGKWMGLGDAKLALGMGWFLGLTAGASAIMLAFWVGAVVSIAILLLAELLKGARTHNFLGLKFRLSVLNMKSEIPFAPFLIIGLLIVYFFSYNIVAHLSLF